jgi:hypothetical protein
MDAQLSPLRAPPLLHAKAAMRRPHIVNKKAPHGVTGVILPFASVQRKSRNWEW